MTEKEKCVQLLNFAEELATEFEKSCAEENLNRTEVSMLSIIRRAALSGKKVISTQIANELSITRSAVSQTVDRLEERGYVVREHSETDKKIAYIVLSESYKAKIEDKSQELIVVAERVFSEMGEEQTQTLLSLLSRFRDIRKNPDKGVK